MKNSMTREGNWLTTDVVYVTLEDGTSGYAHANDIRSLRWSRESYNKLKEEYKHLEKCYLANLDKENK